MIRAQDRQATSVVGSSSKIKRAFGLFCRGAFDGMRVNHRGSQVAVAQELLNGPNVVIGLQQMAGKGVSERMR